METQNDKELAEVLVAISIIARRLADKLSEGGSEDGNPCSED